MTWTPRPDGPAIPDGWVAERRQSMVDGPSIRYEHEVHVGTVDAYRDCVLVDGPWTTAFADLRQLLDRAEWDRHRLARGEEP